MIVDSRGRREEPDQRPCADSRRPERRRRPRHGRVQAPHTQSCRLRRARSPPPAIWTIGTGNARLAAMPATMKIQPESTRRDLRLDAEEATQ